MIVIPAVDIMDGMCVQLVGGRPASKQLVLPSPVQVAIEWQRRGARCIHIIDLDAAMDRGDNGDLVKAILSKVKTPLQVGGGLRDEKDIGRVLQMGAERAIVGTRWVEDFPWLRAISQKFPGKVVPALDVRNGKVLTHGWTREVDVDPVEMAKRLDQLRLAAILYTSVDREGQMAGIDHLEVRKILRAIRTPLLVAGGVSTIYDVKKLRNLGAYGSVVGIALYTGAIVFEEVNLV